MKFLNNQPVLEISDLSVSYQHGDQLLEAVRDISMKINLGETYGLAGESGSGKTTLVLAVMRYLGSRARITKGNIFLGDLDLRSLNDQQLRRVWRSEIALVPQDPLSSLNPSMKIGDQLAEVLQLQADTSHHKASQLSKEWLHQVHIPDPERVASSYPHQISGGMQQRVLIAMALSSSPSLLVLDEPTTNLDVTTQAVILDLIGELIQDYEMAILYVTHNLGVIAQYCDRVGIMYASELVEADTVDIFSKPLHPYTIGLLESIPRIGDTKDDLQLKPIEGQIPALGQVPSGCVFRTRCPIIVDACYERPQFSPAGGSRFSRCHRWQEIDNGKVNALRETPPIPSKQNDFTVEETYTLQIKNLSVSFPIQRSLRDMVQHKAGSSLQAVNHVNLEISPGSTLGLVGESGSGKTTIARAIIGLQRISTGSIKLNQIDLPDRLSRRDLQTLRQLQIVFQNPAEALNPHFTIGESLSRPLIRLLGISRKDAATKVETLLNDVHLPADYASRYPRELSGGEIQRIALARAIASNPDLLILDEPISSLDVSVQAAILNLVGELQSDHRNSLLFVSHNLAVVGYLADQTAVIYMGYILELSGKGELFNPPHHPYTEALISAIPEVELSRKRKPIYLQGELPDSPELTVGCPFHTRCPRFLGEICIEKFPAWQVDPGTEKSILCHIPLEELSTPQISSADNDIAEF